MITYLQSLEDDLPLLAQFTTQKTSYTFDDTIVISGNIENYWPDEPAQISLNPPYGDVLLELDTPIDNSGNFTFEIIAGGVGWIEEGTYTLNVIHVDDLFINENTSFEYTNLMQHNNQLETIFGQLDAQTQVMFNHLIPKYLVNNLNMMSITNNMNTMNLNYPKKKIQNLLQ